MIVEHLKWVRPMDMVESDPGKWFKYNGQNERTAKTNGLRSVVLLELRIVQNSQLDHNASWMSWIPVLVGQKWLKCMIINFN